MLPGRDTHVAPGLRCHPVKTADLDYDLPEALIATHPAEPRDSARLLVFDRATGEVGHHRVRDLPALGVLRPGDLMLVNQTRVLPAYLRGERASTGGRVTGLFLEEAGAGVWRLMLESRGKPEPGERITLDGHTELVLLTREGHGQWLAQLHADAPTPQVLQRLGATPLPPYIRKQRRRHGEAEVLPDEPERYNTVYADDQAHARSVAAPTAGLHFTPPLLDQVQQMGVRRAAVTLHIGAGTFAPVRAQELDQHQIHTEPFTVPAQTIAAIRTARDENRRILTVGTTTVRAAESLPHDLSQAESGYSATASLFIYPDRGFTFRYTDALLTNFHLPRSTLLALVASLPGVGLDRLLSLYRQAIGLGYRFYSYGDAMLIV